MTDTGTSEEGSGFASNWSPPSQVLGRCSSNRRGSVTAPWGSRAYAQVCRTFGLTDLGVLLYVLLDRATHGLVGVLLAAAEQGSTKAIGQLRQACRTSSSSHGHKIPLPFRVGVADLSKLLLRG